MLDIIVASETPKDSEAPLWEPISLMACRYSF